MTQRAVSLLAFICVLVGQHGGARAIEEGQDAGKEPVVLSVWNVPSKDVLTPGARAERAIFDRFLETHPHITVTWQREQLRAEGPMGESTELIFSFKPSICFTSSIGLSTSSAISLALGS